MRQIKYQSCQLRYHSHTPKGPNQPSVELHHWSQVCSSLRVRSHNHMIICFYVCQTWQITFVVCFPSSLASAPNVQWQVVCTPVRCTSCKNSHVRGSSSQKSLRGWHHISNISTVVQWQVARTPVRCTSCKNPPVRGSGSQKDQRGRHHVSDISTVAPNNEQEWCKWGLKTRLCLERNDNDEATTIADDNTWDEWGLETHPRLELQVCFLFIFLLLY